MVGVEVVDVLRVEGVAATTFVVAAAVTDAIAGAGCLFLQFRAADSVSSTPVSIATKSDSPVEG